MTTEPYGEWRTERTAVRAEGHARVPEMAPAETWVSASLVTDRARALSGRLPQIVHGGGKHA